VLVPTRSPAPHPVPARLLELALPFPDTPGFQFHDTWIAVLALRQTRGYVDRPLYDYVQHRAVFGDVTHGQRPRTRRLAALRQWLRATAGSPGWRATYFTLPQPGGAGPGGARRCAPQLERPKRLVLERFIACDTRAGAGVAGAAPARALIGRLRRSAASWACSGRCLEALATPWRSPRLAPRRMADASIPPAQSFSQKRLRRWRSRI